MEHRLKGVEDLLEIVLNFLVVICVETVLDAMVGGQASIHVLVIPVTAPLVFYAARKWTGSLILFLALHAAVVFALFSLAGQMTGSALWQAGYVMTGIFYSVHSIRIRVTKREDGEGEIPPGLAAAVAVAAFFLCSIQKSDSGCSRILWISLIWLPGLLIRKYLGNYRRYVELNRDTAGTMPEDRIFQSGAVMVGLYSAISIFLLSIGSKTPLVPWLSEMVRRCVRFLLRAFSLLLELLAGMGSPDSAGDGAENGMIEMLEGLEDDVPPAWMRILEQILVAAVLILIVLAALFLVSLLIRFLIQGFYGREKTDARIEEKGYVEEEERLEGRRKRDGEQLPFIGGTPDKRVRRIFRRTVQESLKAPEWSEIKSMTARQLAKLPVGASEEAWTELVLLYEHARYTEKEVTAQEARRAGKLSRQILHTIK